MIETVKVKRTTDISKLRQELKKDGWVSAHYLTRHGKSPDELRKMAKAGQLAAKILDNLGTSTWWYKHAEVAQIN